MVSPPSLFCTLACSANKLQKNVHNYTTLSLHFFFLFFASMLFVALCICDVKYYATWGVL